VVACGYLAGTCACAGESLADTAGPAPKMESQAYPLLKPRVEHWFGTLLSVRFFSLSLLPLELRVLSHPHRRRRLRSQLA
jgi:hypothetical protein